MTFFVSAHATENFSKSTRRPHRQDIIEAAAHAFAFAGFHRTQMADIAERAGVALGTLYRHASSKDAWFADALAFGACAASPAEAFQEGSRSIETFLLSNLPTWFAEDALSALLAGEQDEAPFESVVEAVYDEIAKRRYAIRILDRSAHDLPRLNDIYIQRIRLPALTKLNAYLRQMQELDRLAPLSDTHASSRFILETCAWFAMHRLFSPGGADISDTVARQTAISHLCAAFGQATTKEERPSASGRMVP